MVERVHLAGAPEVAEVVVMVPVIAVVEVCWPGMTESWVLVAELRVVAEMARGVST